MAKDKECSKCANSCGKWSHRSKASGSGLYCIGMVGAAVYYLQQADTFWISVLGLLKAIVWPAFLVHKLLGL